MLFIKLIKGIVNFIYLLNKKSPRYLSGRFIILKWLHDAEKIRKRNYKKWVLFCGLLARKWEMRITYLALYSYMKGYNVVLVYDGKKSRKTIILIRLFQLLNNHTLKNIKVIDYNKLNLRDHKNEDNFKYDIEIISEFNTLYKFGVEELGKDSIKIKYNNSLKSILPVWIRKFIYIMNKYNVSRVVIPSGVILETAAVLKAAKNLNIPTVTLEGWGTKYAQICYAFNRPAITDFDFFNWAKLLKWDNNHEEWLNDYLSYQITGKTSPISTVSNISPYQRSDANFSINEKINHFLNTEKTKVLLATNVIGDSATIMKCKIFKTQKEWIKKVIDYFSEKENLKLIIRIHPSEKWMMPQERLGEFSEKINNSNNITIIKGEEDINTFFIVEKIDFALTWLSTITADIVVRSIPVIVAADAPYSNMKFAKFPNTIEEYFKTIDELIDNKYEVSKKEIEMAKKYLYIANKKRLLFINNGYNFSEWKIKDNYKERKSDRNKLVRILVGELDEFGNKI